MKRIVDGQVYDTATATCIAIHKRSFWDFGKIREALYLTKGGQWFIYGDSSIIFNCPLGGGTYGRIIPLLSAEDVAHWAENADIGEEAIEKIAEALHHLR